MSNHSSAIRVPNLSLKNQWFRGKYGGKIPNSESLNLPESEIRENLVAMYQVFLTARRAATKTNQGDAEARRNKQSDAKDANRANEREYFKKRMLMNRSRPGLRWRVRRKTD